MNLRSKVIMWTAMGLCIIIGVAVAACEPWYSLYGCAIIGLAGFIHAEFKYDATLTPYDRVYTALKYLREVSFRDLCRHFDGILTKEEIIDALEEMGRRREVLVNNQELEHQQ